VLLVIGALPLTDWLLWAPGLTGDNVRRIKPGMTLAEVEALLGGPAQDTFEMPPDYLAYRWQREWREGWPGQPTPRPSLASSHSARMGQPWPVSPRSGPGPGNH
jgi:hypothetical protein